MSQSLVSPIALSKGGTTPAVDTTGENCPYLRLPHAWPYHFLKPVATPGVSRVMNSWNSNSSNQLDIVNQTTGQNMSAQGIWGEGRGCRLS